MYLRESGVIRVTPFLEKEEKIDKSVDKCSSGRSGIDSGRRGSGFWLTGFPLISFPVFHVHKAGATQQRGEIFSFSVQSYNLCMQSGNKQRG